MITSDDIEAFENIMADIVSKNDTPIVMTKEAFENIMAEQEYIDNLINDAYKLLQNSDSIDKLASLYKIKRDLQEFARSMPFGMIEDVANEIEMLEGLNRIGLLESEQTQVQDPPSFRTNLTDTERLELCNKIIAESKSDEPDYKKKFIGSIDMPTLLYLLGGDKPEKIVKIKMTTHQKVYDLLLSISKHTFNGNTCIPNFVKKILCPEVLLNRSGNPIKKLNERVS